MSGNGWTDPKARLGDDLELDVAYVLLNYPVSKLRKLAEDAGVAVLKDDLQNDLVPKIIADSEKGRISSLYEAAVLTAHKVSVSWLRGIPVDRTVEFIRGIAPAPVEPSELRDVFGRVWLRSDGQQQLARLAYRPARQSAAVRHGLWFLNHSVYGYVTLRWHRVDEQEVLELWAPWDQVRSKLLPWLAREAGIDLQGVECLDVRDYPVFQRLKAGLKARWPYAKAKIDSSSGTALSHIAVIANINESVDNPDDVFVAGGYDQMPAERRRLTCAVPNREDVSFDVSRLAPSFVFYGATMSATSHVLQEAIKHGDWTKLSEDAPPGSYPRASGKGRPRKG